MTSAASRRLRVCLLMVGVLLPAAAVIPFAGAKLRADKPAPPPAPVLKTPLIEPVYAVEAGLDGEIFPALANYASLQKPRNRKLATVTVRATNPSNALLKNRIAVQVPGWSDQEIQMVEVAPGETRTFRFAPTFLPRLFMNREIAAATAVVAVDDGTGRTVFTTTIPVRLRAAEDMYWGTNFKYAPFIAAWVTPHDPMVEAVLSRAKEYMPGRRLPGYEERNNTAAQVNSTYLQARAIYKAVQATGVSYVKSSLTFGAHQGVSERVRLPRETLRHISANCIDGAVMYASLFENLGLDAVVVLVPGHAYVGVREAQNSQTYLYLETSLTGRTSFENAVLSASRGLGKYPADRVIRIGIAQARGQGIFPMPEPSRTAAMQNEPGR